MKTTLKRLSLIIFSIVASLLLLYLFSTTILAGSNVALAEMNETDPDLGVEIGPGNSYVLLENSQILVRYEPFFDNTDQFAIRQFVMKNAGFFDQAGMFLDADEFRGTLNSASLIYDGSDRKTVRLIWNASQPSRTIIHEVSIYPNRPFLKIDYVNVDDGINIVDMGLPGGTDHGTHIAYGGDTWIRGYVTQDYTPTVGSYYNRHPEDGVFDPSNGGSLNYHGYFILGVYNGLNNIGYGRVMPVNRIPIIKLLVDDTHRRGFEFLPLGTPSSFTGYLFPITSGPNEILEMGKLLADGNYGSYSPTAFQSDDFKRCSWGLGPWTFTDPLGDATFINNGTQVLLTVPPGVDHDIWGTGPGDFANNAARIMQPATDTDLEIEVKFDSGVTSRYQTQGILVKQDDNDWLRFEFHSNGTNTRIFAGRIMDGMGINIGGPLGIVGAPGIAPLYMKVRRWGDLWSQFYSLDGTNWQIYETMYSTMTVSEVGTYAGSTADIPGTQPGHTAIIDYFFNTSSPVVPEDGNPNSLTVNVIGGGSVTKEPNLSDYTCGSSVSLRANPNTGWGFTEWSGDLSGNNNPATLIISGDHTVTATFTQLEYTLAVNTVGNGTVTKNPDKPTYHYGEQVTLTAIPAVNWVFAGWSGSITGMTNPIIINVSGNMSITANFNASYYIYLPGLFNNFGLSPQH